GLVRGLVGRAADQGRASDERRRAARGRAGGTRRGDGGRLRSSPAGARGSGGGGWGGGRLRSALAPPGDQVAHGGDVLRGPGAGGRALRQGGQPRGAAPGSVHHRGNEDHERNRVRGGGRRPGGAGGELPARRVRTGPFPSRPPCLKLPPAARPSTSRRPSPIWSSATRRTCS